MRAKQHKKAEREAAEEEMRRAASRKTVPPDPPLPPLPPKFFRVSQVAEMLNVSATTVQRWFRPYALIVQGSRKATMLIPARALDDWIREHMAQ